jgi:hypothetical protein
MSLHNCSRFKPVRGAPAQTNQVNPKPEEVSEEYLREHCTKLDDKIPMRDGVKLFTFVDAPYFSNQIVRGATVIRFVPLFPIVQIPILWATKFSPSVGSQFALVFLQYESRRLCLVPEFVQIPIGNVSYQEGDKICKV